MKSASGCLGQGAILSYCGLSELLPRNYPSFRTTNLNDERLYNLELYNEMPMFSWPDLLFFDIPPIKKKTWK